jgi:hypothetical protein
MGEAKRRGTFEERKANAEPKNNKTALKKQTVIHEMSISERIVESHIGSRGKARAKGWSY